MIETAAAPELLERLGLLLDRAVRKLGDADETDAAARLAAEVVDADRQPAVSYDPRRPCRQVVERADLEPTHQR